MADDTRQSPKIPITDDGVPITKDNLTQHPENKPFSGKQWNSENAPHLPPQNANLLAGGTQNTAGGKIPEVSLANAWPKFADFTSLHKRPCVRDAGLTGMGAGFALGGMRLVFGASVGRASNWAVSGICLGSVVMYQYCLYKKQAEREGMMRAVEILNKNALEKKAREQAKEKQKEERRKFKESELDAQFANARLRDEEGGKKPWYKVW